MQLLYLNPAQIEHDPQGVREKPGELEGLAETIRDHGLLQPIGVVALSRDRYRIVYGGRRLGAALQLGLERVPCVVVQADDPDLLLRQLIENIQRRNLNDMEQAYAFRRLREWYTEQDGELSEAELDSRIGRAVGMAPRTVRRYLGLLDLPDEVQQLVRDEELTVTQAQHLRRVTKPATQIELARMVADEGLSAAEVSNLANYFAANPNLTVDAALEALSNGADLRTKAPPAPEPLDRVSRAPAPPAESDDDLWADEPEDTAGREDGDFGHLALDDEPSRTKARVFRIKSLDQMVDETDRLARAYHEGDLQKWLHDDDAAAFKLRLLLKQLRSLARAIEEIAGRQGWEVVDE
ncbi:MAG TPA: ParB/RepB/Spo0J family partition protein [Herpetosiphonaceae bacterium]|nr:ParB/RepB/Spo0J family partition protein [Herpetosiphonaceae bacterium]